MGSEMCIRDRLCTVGWWCSTMSNVSFHLSCYPYRLPSPSVGCTHVCILATSVQPAVLMVSTAGSTTVCYTPDTVCHGYTSWWYAMQVCISIGTMCWVTRGTHGSGYHIPSHLCIGSWYRYHRGMVTPPSSTYSTTGGSATR